MRETVALLLFFGPGGRRKLPNLAGEQEVNPFCLPLKEKKKHKMEEENRDKMYKLNYAQDLGSKQNEWKKREERQKIQYKASSPGCVTEKILVMSRFQPSSFGMSRRVHLKFFFSVRSLSLTEDVS